MGFASFREQVDGLTFREQRVIIIFVQRAFKKLTACSLLFLFTLGIWCASLAALDLSVASATERCPKSSLALGKMDCDQPNFMCSFGPDPRSLSSVAIISPRTHELPKAVPLPIGGPAITGPPYEVSLAAISPVAVNLHFQKKVSIHLFNSVLNL